MTSPRIFLALLICLISGIAHSASIRGVVSDEEGRPIPYANILVKNTNKGVAANDRGEYLLHISEGTYVVKFSALGFDSKEVNVELKKGEILSVNPVLKQATTNLGEVEVIADKRDRAKEIMKLVRDHRKENLDRIQNFECSSYLKTTLEKLRKGDPSDRDSLDPKEYEVIEIDSFRDTFYVKQIANLFELSSTLFREYPGRTKEIIHAYDDHEIKDVEADFQRQVSVEATYEIDQQTIAPEQRVSENVYVIYPDNTAGDVNFYMNTIDLPGVSQKPLLSPLAATSSLSYTYDYVGFFFQDDKKIHKIKVNPILKSESLFAGELFVEDSTWALRSVNLSANPPALNFCDELRITQLYDQVDSQAVLPVRTTIEYVITDDPFEYFGTTHVRYSNYTLNQEFDRKFFNSEIKVFDPEAFDRDTTFWLNERPELLNASEMRFIDESDSIDLYYVSDEYYRKVDSAFNRIDWWTPLIGLGRRNRAAGTEWFVQGLIGQINPIGVGGYRHQLPMYFQKEFANDHKVKIDLIPNYGFYNEDFKLKGEIGYTYYPKKFVQTKLIAGDFYERVNTFSSLEQIFSRTNFVNAVTLGVAQRMEIVNGLFAQVTCLYSDQRPITSVRVSPWEELLFDTLSVRRPFDRYIKSEIKLEVQYRFRQKYFIRGNKKIIVGSDYPELYGVWRKGIPDLFGSEVNFDYVELGIRDDQKFARLGESHWQVFGGSFLNKANLRPLEHKFLRGSDRWFFSDPARSLQLLGPTFSTPNPFLQANYIHHFEGTILNKVPLLNYLRLELAAGGGGLFVSDENFAQVEVFAGLERAVRIKKQLFRFGLYAVTADNSVSTADWTLKFGINFFDTFSDEWIY